MTVREWLRVWLEWTLIGVGLTCVTIYSYEAVEARRFQREKAAAFERLAAAGVDRPIERGGLIGMLDIPRLDLSTAVVEGDDERTLKRSAGHLPDTPLPWLGGNSAIAGHRDGLFRPLKDIRIGDQVRFRTGRATLEYRVTATKIVGPDDVSVLRPGARPGLTLITCYPFSYVGTAPKRFVVHAERLPDKVM